MPRIEERIEIAASRADVFRFCHDLKSRPEWDEQVSRAELLTPRPLRQGSLVRIDARYAGGSVFTWDGEFISYQMPTGSIVRMIDTAPSSPFSSGSEQRWQLEQVGTNTRFTWTWEYRSKGFIAKILNSVWRHRQAQAAIQRSLNNLKELVEGGRRARV